MCVQDTHIWRMVYYVSTTCVYMCMCYRLVLHTYACTHIHVHKVCSDGRDKVRTPLQKRNLLMALFL